jgi:hypothetical protein
MQENKMFQKINNQVRFKGSLKKRNYFEGWYYKIVNADKNYSITFILGISINKDNSHTFVQVFLTKKNNDLKTRYVTFRNSPFEISVSKNIFSEDYIDIAIHEFNINVEGKLYFSNITKIKTSFFSP